jgi:hypothetical protein
MTMDGGPMPVDGGPMPTDGGPLPIDGGGMDGGPVAMDGGPMVTDGGPMIMDAGPMIMDAGPPPSLGITRVRAAAPGTLTPPIVASGRVTYIRPAVGGDPAGFFVQAERTGPALFVAIAPGVMGVPTELAVGDDVEVTVTRTEVVAAQHRVTGLSDLTVVASGGDVSALVQDVSAVNVVARLGEYESELIRITGTVANDFAGCVAPLRCAQLTTTGVTTPSNNLRVRIPDTAESSTGLVQGCTVTVGPTPLWRFDAAAQPSAWRRDEVVASSCPSVPAPATGGVVITEILAARTGMDNDREWFEVLNPGMSAVDLGGCVVSDASAMPYTIPDPLVVAPGQRVIFAGSMAEVEADHRFPMGSMPPLDDADSLTITCDGTLIDTVAWSMAAGFPIAIDDVSWQLAPGSSTATANDMGANWCNTPEGTTYAGGLRGSPNLVNPACPAVGCMTRPDHLVINEVDYDNPGTDNAEYVEIYNPTDRSLSLDGLALVFFNAGTSGAPQYRSVSLPAMSLDPGRFAVVTVPAVALPDTALRVAFSGTIDMIQNGAPDAIALMHAMTSTVIDAVAYEGSVPSVTPMGGSAIPLGTRSASIGEDPGDGALARIPDGCDRGTPGMDWVRTTMLTPGAPNMR